MKDRYFDKPMEHRARCKHCGGLPKYYTTVGSGRLHCYDQIIGTIDRINRASLDYNRRPRRNMRNFPHEKVMRGNQIRGCTVTNLWYFSSGKYEGIGFRVILGCECGKSTWMFSPHSGHLQNRQIELWFSKYIKKRKISRNANLDLYF